LHRYDYGEFWPNLRQGDFDHIGEKDGKGFNVNIPLNKVKPTKKHASTLIWIKFVNILFALKIGLGNSEYSAAFHNLLLPMAYEV